MVAKARKSTVVAASPRVVYTQAPLSLASITGRRDGKWCVRLGDQERELEAPGVDPALLEEVLARQGRVFVETIDGVATIAGVLQTRRAIEIDAEGKVDVQVSSFRVKAMREAILTTERAYVWVKGNDVELYGKEVLTRAREVAKILGRLISLN